MTPIHLFAVVVSLGWLLSGAALAAPLELSQTDSSPGSTEAEAVTSAEGAEAVVHRFMEAHRTNNRDAYLDALADSYDYSGIKKSDFDPFGDSSTLYERFVYRVVQILAMEPGVSTAIVDAHYTGHFKQSTLEAAGLGQPRVAGTLLLWLETRRQENDQWRITAIRPLHWHFVHGGTPPCFVEGATVNGATSLQVSPGAALRVEGQTSAGTHQQVSISGSARTIPLRGQDGERWEAELVAPSTPGSYYVAIQSLTLGVGSDGLLLALDEITIPVTVK